MIAAKGFDTADPILRAAIRQQVGSTVKRLHRNGEAENIGAGRASKWKAGRRLAGLAFRDMLKWVRGSHPFPESMTVPGPRGALYAERGRLSPWFQCGNRDPRRYARFRSLLRKMLSRL